MADREESKETFLDIGAGFGERFIQRAKENPDKQFVVVEPETDLDVFPIKEALPENLKWIKGKIDERHHLPLRDSSIDEANLDCVLFYLAGDEKQALFPKVISEALRVLKKGGVLYIREPKHMLDSIRPVLQELTSEFMVSPIPIDEAKERSVSLKEIALEYESGREELKGMQPYLITVRK